MTLACTPKSSYNIKSFFFDGVPDPNLKTAANDEATLVEEIQDSTILFKVANTIHPPYKEKTCLECHAKENMGQPKMELPNLCYQCHDDFSKSNAYLHGPVGSGNCTQCHNPHKSKLERLLVRNGQDLCLKCHIKDKVIENRVHEDIASKSCMECHDPHGGENKLFLQKNSCFQCHEDFTKQTQFVHGPVASGKCSTCHESHKSTAEKLLVNTGSQLCLNCHNKADIYDTAYHIEEQETSCVNCHNAHGSNIKYLLTPDTPKP